MVEEMSKEELMKISVEEFSRLQKRMLGTENNSPHIVPCMKDI